MCQRGLGKGTMPRVFTIPVSAPFLATLIGALKDGRLIEGFPGRGALALADATLFLPTRRACVLAREAFLDVIGTDAVALPRIIALGEIDEDELPFADRSEEHTSELHSPDHLLFRLLLE